MGEKIPFSFKFYIQEDKDNGVEDVYTASVVLHPILDGVEEKKYAVAWIGEDGWIKMSGYTYSDIKKYIEDGVWVITEEYLGEF